MCVREVSFEELLTLLRTPQVGGEREGCDKAISSIMSYWANCSPQTYAGSIAPWLESSRDILDSSASTGWRPFG